VRMSPGETQQIGERAGLRFVRLVDVPPYHYACIFRRE
jgi:hypothetical protein